MRRRFARMLHWLADRLDDLAWRLEKPWATKVMTRQLGKDDEALRAMRERLR
jgi:hypothetical protein